jgi:NADPH-dependent curcumin reductase CurA
MTDNIQIQVAAIPNGQPSSEHFQVVATSMPAPSEGQVLCATQYLSLDPYMRSQLAGMHMSGTVKQGELMRGETLSKVLESNNPDFSVGDIVRCFGNWQQYSVHEGSELAVQNENIQPASYGLSVLGMPGLTAYSGLIWMAKLKKDDVVLIPAATGAVGSTAGQLAKIEGCRVIGIAGSDAKCQYAVEELGYDACINRKTDDLAERLTELCPNGIDVYFDLVGGETLNTVCTKLALNARVILCGLMEDYNKPTRSYGPKPGPIIGARATLMGLVVYDWESRREEFTNACLPYVADGRLRMREDMGFGIESAPEVFCKLMRGDNQGKAIVKVAID